MRRRLGIALVFLVMTVMGLGATPKTSIAADGWRRVAPGEMTLEFNAPGLEDVAPTRSAFVQEQRGARSEWACWRRLSNVKASGCVSYQNNGSLKFRYYPPSELKWLFKDYPKVSFRVESTGNLEGKLGKLETARFKVYWFKGPKDCISFSRFMNGRRRHLRAYYCTAIGGVLSPTMIEEIATTLKVNAIN